MAAPQIESARLLSAIVDSSDDAIVSKDLDGIVTSWNGAAERMFGWTAEEMIGRSIRTIIPPERMSEEDAVLAAIRRGDRVDHFETVRMRKNGERITISLTVSPIRDASGTVMGASKIARDITEVKRAEAALQLANAREIFLGDVTAALSSSLEAAASLQAMASLAVPRIADWCAIDLVGENGGLEHVAVANVNPDKVQVAREVRERYSSPDSPYGPSHVIKTKRSSIIPLVTDEMIVNAANGDKEREKMVRSLGLVSYMIVPIVAHGRALGALTLATSESGIHYGDDDLRFAEELAARAALFVENAHAYRQIDTANRLKEEFLATLSHELRTPLNAVMGYARMLKAGTIAGEKTAQALDVIDRNASALAQIVEDVLDISRIVTGKTRLEVQPVDLNNLLKNAVASVTPAIEAKGLRLQILMDSHVGPVSGDPDRLQQVIWNLLSNAVKFTPRGGRLQVRLERRDSHASIVVSDTGIGISPAFLPFIFERFRQAEAGTTRRHGGLGLGLAIARHLVEMHGGTIQATSEGEGQGTTFRVTLPLMIVHAVKPPEVVREGPRTGAEPPAQTSDGTDLSGIRVLAVDDDADALRLMCDVLEAAGANLTAVNSADAALETLRVLRPDVLVSDLGMPDTDGFELIRRVRQLEDPGLRDIPAAALTAYARSGDRSKSLRSGFEMHLAKPIEPSELVAAVAALARRNRSVR